MKECHVCHYMCEDGAEICPVCGAELLSGGAVAAAPAEITNPVLAASVDSPVTAEMMDELAREIG